LSTTPEFWSFPTRRKWPWFQSALFRPATRLAVYIARVRFDDLPILNPISHLSQSIKVALHRVALRVVDIDWPACDPIVALQWVVELWLVGNACGFSIQVDLREIIRGVRREPNQ